MIKFVNDTPIISEANIKAAIKEMHDMAFLMAMFEDEKPKKKTVKKWRQEIISWARFWEVEHLMFNAIIESNAKKIRAMQEADGLMVTLSDILCNVCTSIKDGPNKDSILRAQEILVFIRSQVGWNIDAKEGDANDQEADDRQGKAD